MSSSHTMPPVAFSLAEVVDVEQPHEHDAVQHVHPVRGRAPGAPHPDHLSDQRKHCLCDALGGFSQSVTRLAQVEVVSG